MKYEGWLVSDNLMKRVLAIWGHFMIGYIILVLLVAFFITFIK